MKSNQIKKNLLKIQQEIVDKCGLEAEGIDLVNGKYDEQIKKLDELSRQKANDYVIENGKNIEADKKKISGNVIITTGSYIQTNRQLRDGKKVKKKLLICGMNISQTIKWRKMNLDDLFPICLVILQI